MPDRGRRRRVVVQNVVAGDRRINLDFILENPLIIYFSLPIAEALQRFGG